MKTDLLQFDRDITLAELIRALPRKKLETILFTTVGSAWRMIDNDGIALLGSDAPIDGPIIAVPLVIDIDVVGQLLAPTGAKDQVTAAATWLELVFASAYRYQMAADLHLQAVSADYEALQLQHTALKESEARFRVLTEQLDQRVQEQVKVIAYTQRQLFQTEKMASIGSLSAGMAHEINNPIGFIRSNINTATTYFEKMHQALEALRSSDRASPEAIWQMFDIEFIVEDFPGLLTESIAGADRIARIIANLKAYANIDCSFSNVVSINDAARAVGDILSDQLPENIVLEMNLLPLPYISGDQSRINQMLFSLTQNARQALNGKSGTISIGSRVVDNEICITVSDNGCGISQDIMNRIFDPFFTTHDVGGGMGLGLTVSHDIVSAHGGKIEVESAVGSGSTFTVWLPIDPPEDSYDGSKGAA